jgi:hypothetical protein
VKGNQCITSHAEPSAAAFMIFELLPHFSRRSQAIAWTPDDALLRQYVGFSPPLRGPSTGTGEVGAGVPGTHLYRDPVPFALPYVVHFLLALQHIAM